MGIKKVKRDRVAHLLPLFFFLLLTVAGTYFYSANAQNKKVLAATDTCTWTGNGGDTDITTAGNWTGCDNGNIPESGDNLVFPAGPTNKIVNVDSLILFADITFSGSGYTVTSVPLTPLGATDQLTISGNNNTFDYVRFYPSTNFTFSHSATGTTFNDYIVFEPQGDVVDVILDIDTDLSLPIIAQTSSGPGSSIDVVTKTGNGTLEFTGTPLAGFDLDNAIVIDEGRWKCDSIHCLGETTNEIILNEGGDEDAAELHLNHSGTFSNPITTANTTGDNGSIIISGSPTLDGAITVFDNLNVFVSGSNTANIDSAISITDTKTLTTYGVDGYATNAIDYGGIISGNGGLIVDDAHVTLSGSSNTYAGTTELYNNALLTVTNNNSQGSHVAGTVVNSGTTLEYDNVSDIGYGEPLTVSGSGIGDSYPGALVKTGGEMQLEGGVTLAADATFYNATEEVFEVNSVVTGDYDLTLTSAADAGGFSIEPNGNNSFGDLTINGAEVGLWGSGDLAVPNNITINAVDGQATSITQNNDSVIADDAVIALNNEADEEAMLISNGVIETVGTITGDGTISMLDSDSSYSIGGGNISGTFNGVVEGYTNSQFQIIGGVWTFSGRSQDVGNGYSSFYVNGGKFIADASDTSLGLSPFSISSGILGGTGIIGGIAVYGGGVSPGTSPGCLYPGGDVAFNEPTSSLTIELDGTTQCSGYDVLNASGVVYLNNAALNIEVGFQPNNGDVFTIVQGSSVVGTFDGLADGDTIVANNHTFRINYSSDNVTLTYIAPASAASSGSSSLADTGVNTQAILVIALFMLSSSGLFGANLRRSLKLR